MPIQSNPEMTELSRVPMRFRDTVSRRGVWRLCSVERSCVGPIHDFTPSAPFHHFVLRLDQAPLKMGWILDGKRLVTDMPKGHLSIVPAGVSFTGSLSRPVDSACLYFMPSALTAAAGEEALVTAKAEIRPMLDVHSPTLCRLIAALHADTVQGHPYGMGLGESIFVSMASLLVNDGRIVSQRLYRERVGDRRIRRTLEYIHTHLDQEIDLCSIAAAASTSPYHLNRTFRSALGSSIWQYVLRNRVQLAIGLMKDSALTLAQVAAMSGFESYSTFAATFKVDRGVSPARFRSDL
jgi:AraC family transcriptional regulator